MKNNKIDYKTWLPIKRYIAAFNIIMLCIPFLLSSDELFFKIALSLDIALLLFYGAFIVAHFILKKNDFDIQHKLSEVLINQVPEGLTGNALDLGTGNGIAAIHLAKSNHELHVFGMDVWSNKWDYSMQQCIINANLEGVADRTAFAEGSGFSLPIQPSRMSLIISNYAIHTMKEYDKKFVFQELIRTLKFDGYLVIQDFFRKRYFGDIDELITYLSEFGLKLISRVETEELVKVPKLLKILDIAGNSEIWVLQKKL